MTYFKLTINESETVEAHENPVYVRQTKNGVYRCEQQFAQGIVSLDQSGFYQLPDKAALPEVLGTAVQITTAEYEEWIAIHGEPDHEDVDPVIPDGDEEEIPLTRAELTAKVAELEEQNAMLVECILEMSEIVYG